MSHCEIDQLRSHVTNISAARTNIELAITAIRKEIAGAPPFAKANDVRRAEIDQLTDMIDRRR